MGIYIKGYHVNRQIGRYVVYSKEANVAPFFVRMLRDDAPLSTHWSVTDAVQAIMRYRAADARRAKHNAPEPNEDRLGFGIEPETEN